MPRPFRVAYFAAIVLAAVVLAPVVWAVAAGVRVIAAEDPFDALP